MLFDAIGTRMQNLQYSVFLEKYAYCAQGDCEHPRTTNLSACCSANQTAIRSFMQNPWKMHTFLNYFMEINLITIESGPDRRPAGCLPVGIKVCMCASGPPCTV